MIQLNTKEEEQLLNSMEQSTKTKAATKGMERKNDDETCCAPDSGVFFTLYKNIIRFFTRKFAQPCG